MCPGKKLGILDQSRNVIVRFEIAIQNRYIFLYAGSQMIQKVLPILWFLIAVPLTLQAQDTYYELAARNYRTEVYSEAFAFPGGATSTLIISFRIPNSRLVFFRNRSESPGRLFIAEVELTVEIYRSRDKVAEEIWRRDHYVGSFEDTQSKDLDLQGMIQFSLDPGTYGYRLVLKDANTCDYVRQSWLEPVVVPDFDRFSVGYAVPAGSIENTDNGVILDLINLSGDGPYGRASMTVVPVGLDETTKVEDISIQYVLYRRNDDEVRQSDRALEAMRQRIQRAGRGEYDVPPMLVNNEPHVDESDVIASAELDGTFLIPISSSHSARYGAGRIQWSRSGEPAGYLFPIELAPELLADGAYLLDISLKNDSYVVSSQSRFRTHWRNMPLSLYSATVAIRNLRFILDSRQIRSMLRGSRAAREQNLRSFWKTRDLSPDTEYNELMAEYYRRIDYAAYAFRTVKNPFPDGLDTDRALVYIKHGPADKIERSFPPTGGVEEVWHYAEGRQFFFWSPSSIETLELKRDGDR